MMWKHQCHSQALLKPGSPASVVVFYCQIMRDIPVHMEVPQQLNSLEVFFEVHLGLFSPDHCLMVKHY